METTSNISNETKSNHLSPINFLSRKHSLTLKPLFQSSTSLDFLPSKSKPDQTEGNSNERQGRWLQSEHFRFLKGCLLYGNNWGEVKKCVKSRSSAQIRSHAQKYLIKLCKKYSNHPLFNINSKKDIDYNYDEDYLEDYEIFPEEILRELLECIRIDSINPFNLDVKMSLVQLSPNEKIESVLLGIFKCTGSKNLIELDLVRSLEPRIGSLTGEEVETLERLGSDESAFKVLRKKSSMRVERKRERNVSISDGQLLLSQNSNGNACNAYTNEYNFIKYLNNINEPEENKENNKENKETSRSIDRNDDTFLPSLNFRVKNRSNSSFVPLTQEEIKEKKSFYQEESREKLNIHRSKTQILINNQNDDENKDSNIENDNGNERINENDRKNELISSIIKKHNIDVFDLEMLIKQSKKVDFPVEN